jgi:hypothetical protein
MDRAAFAEVSEHAQGPAARPATDGNLNRLGSGLLGRREVSIDAKPTADWRPYRHRTWLVGVWENNGLDSHIADSICRR